MGWRGCFLLFLAMSNRSLLHFCHEMLPAEILVLTGKLHADLFALIDFDLLQQGDGSLTGKVLEAKPLLKALEPQGTPVAVGEQIPALPL
jgi:hypothetical protein